ncbi:MAG: hypothetical protein JW795_12600 [Chitinivibrionales bacterium]|nr:hypothetical protein [Chitinivibrionales bacterium]
MANKKNIERKHFFINRKLQGRYMITFLIPMMIMLLFMLVTLYYAANSLMDIAAQILQQDLQNQTATHIQDKVSLSTELYQKIIRDILDYGAHFSSNAHYRKAVISSLIWIFGIGVTIVIIQIVLLTVFFSHKLAGPIYRFETVCHNIIRGTYTDSIVLRKGDDMQNLALLFNQVIEKTRTRFHAIEKAESLDDVKKILQSLEL